MLLSTNLLKLIFRTIIIDDRVLFNGCDIIQNSISDSRELSQIAPIQVNRKRSEIFEEKISEFEVAKYGSIAGSVISV